MKQQKYALASSLFLSKRYKLSIVVLFMGAAMLLLSCSVDKKKQKQLQVYNQPVNMPDISANDYIVTESQKGVISFRLSTELMIKNTSRDKTSYTEFPNGFLIEKFDSTGTVIKQISANYGRSYDDEDKYEASGNVVATNETGDTLKTEHLIYLRAKKRLYSDKFVRIIQKDKIITGIGFESDEDFTNRIIYKPQGIIYVNPDEEE